MINNILLDKVHLSRRYQIEKIVGKVEITIGNLLIIITVGFGCFFGLFLQSLI